MSAPLEVRLQPGEPVSVRGIGRGTIEKIGGPGAFPGHVLFQSEDARQWVAISDLRPPHAFPKRDS